jgi:hypothetical protein
MTEDWKLLYNRKRSELEAAEKTVKEFCEQHAKIYMRDFKIEEKLKEIHQKSLDFEK